MDPSLQRLVALLLTLAGLVSQGAGIAMRAAGPAAQQLDGQASGGSATIQTAVPPDLTPSIKRAASDMPANYTDGCHAKAGQTKAKVCTYGDTGSAVKVLLFGDSHAVSWQPALDQIGKQQHWRILALTKSACPIPTVTVAVRGKVSPDCATWRTNALKRIAKIHPDLVVATSFDHVYTIPGKTGPAFLKAWRKGMTRTLSALRKGAGKVVLLGDSPLWKQEAPTCLRHNPNHIERCATKRSEALFPGRIANNRRAAQDAGVAFADTTAITCLADPCPVISGNILMLRDDSHMTATWSRHLWSDLLALLPDPAS